MSNPLRDDANVRDMFDLNTVASPSTLPSWVTTVDKFQSGGNLEQSVLHGLLSENSDNNVMFIERELQNLLEKSEYGAGYSEQLGGAQSSEQLLQIAGAKKSKKHKGSKKSKKSKKSTKARKSKRRAKRELSPGMKAYAALRDHIRETMGIKFGQILLKLTSIYYNAADKDADKAKQNFDNDSASARQKKHDEAKRLVDEKKAARKAKKAGKAEDSWSASD